MTTVQMDMPLDNMVTVETLMKNLDGRANDREDFFMPQARDAKFQYNQPELGGEVKRGMFTMNLDGEEFEVSNSAIRSACKLMKTSREFFQRNFPNWQQKLCRDFVSAVDHLERGVIARTDTRSNGTSRRIESFSPSTWNTQVQETDMIRGVAERLNAQYEDSLIGVQHLSHKNARTDAFRFIFGQPVIGEGANVKMYPMLSLIHSPYGFANTELTLGLYRVICKNGMLRQDFKAGRAMWNQTSNPDRFFQDIRETVDVAGDFASYCSQALVDMPNKELSHHPMEILGGLNNSRLINRDHFDLSCSMLPEREVKTEYDMLNLLTDSVKGIRSLARRQYGEGVAMRIGMQRSGFSGVLDGGFDKSYATNQFAGIRRN